MDDALKDTFGASVPELHETAAGTNAAPALVRALEMRAFLALAEQQVARVRDRVHADTEPRRDIGELSAEKLSVDAQWLQAALEARNGYRAALGQLLRTEPVSEQQARPVRLAQLRTAAISAPVAAPSPPRDGAAPARRT